MVDAGEFMANLKPWFAEHLQQYLSDPESAQYIDGRQFGGGEKTTCLLLQTIGRKSGAQRVTPLIYDRAGDEFMIIASNGGQDFHPSWFLNLSEMPDVRFRIGLDCFEGTWRVAEGAEREGLWAQMKAYYPPYQEYESRTDRQIPVVLLRAESAISDLSTSPREEA